MYLTSAKYILKFHISIIYKFAVLRYSLKNFPTI